MTKKEAQKITGVEPRKVYYCLWNDGTKSGTRYACCLYNIVECETEEEAKAKAISFQQNGRKRKFNEKTLYPSYANEYYQMRGKFVPTVFTYITKTFSNWKYRYGYFINRWSLDCDLSCKGMVICNFYGIKELDSKEPINEIWLNREIDRISA